MELQEIDVTIAEDGEVEIEVRGAKGDTCLDLTADLEEALGGQVVNREMTAEAHESDVRVQDHERVRNQ